VTQFPPWRRLSVSLLAVWNGNNTSSSAADVTPGYSNMRLFLITNVEVRMSQIVPRGKHTPSSV